MSESEENAYCVNCQMKIPKFIEKHSKRIEVLKTAALTVYSLEHFKCKCGSADFRITITTEEVVLICSKCVRIYSVLRDEMYKL
jgi:hypothetical protein